MPENIESVLNEKRVFQPPKAFAEAAHIKAFAEFEALYDRADKDPEGFWADVARELDWFEPLPGATPTKPGSCTRALPGIAADVVTRDGKSCAPNEGGFLVIRKPWPAMLRTIHGDPPRYEKYWNEIPAC